jgi:hypothetical protein
MAAKKQAPRHTYQIETPANGRVGKSTVLALDAAGKVVHSDRANMADDCERRRLARRMAEKLEEDPSEVLKDLEQLWNQTLDEHRRFRDQARAGPAGAPPAEVLDAAPDVIRRPLCLVAGHAYAACWPHVQTTVTQGVDAAGAPVTYDPPRVESRRVLVVVRDDGQAFAESPVAGALPLAELGVDVRLPAPVPPGGGWSGAGLKRYLRGERADPADVFHRITLVVDAHIDFERSLAAQTPMCELVALFVLASYFLDAFDVVGYLWPNGDKGTGKTHFLAVLTELAYLGLLILAGGSYASLRDLADYGACLAFDDAEGIMDVKRTDPDKRALLLAGNRRGATVTVKEQEGERWVTRFIHTFCPRAFSAIRLPDDVLASRTIMVPLVRSCDAARARSEPLDHARWPCDRRRLVDDLWAVGLAHLPELRDYDAMAAEGSGLVGRELEPWRAIFAVALWLEERHGVAGLYDRMRALAEAYRHERGDLEAGDPVRVAVQALRKIVAVPAYGGRFTPKQLAEEMKRIADDEDLAEPDKPFTTPRRVGWLLKRLRVRRGERDERAKVWVITAEDLEALARAYGLTT